MSNPRSHHLHKGELLVQKRRRTPIDLAEQIPNYINSNMPQQHAEFYEGLSYFPLTALDERGRPWASLLVTKSEDDTSVGIEISTPNEMSITAQVNPFDPLVKALSQTKNQGVTPFAGVGVDFSNRRRNKVAGAIEKVHSDSPEKINLQLKSDEHLGNCPKYITVRSLEPYQRKAELILNQFDALESPLPTQSKAIIQQASTVFLATKHEPDGDNKQEHTDMGLNHRGGSPGFVRLYEETTQSSDKHESTQEIVTTYLILPDYSGNRFYQSLGNIQSSKLVGIVFPDFNSGSLLYITGKAENLFEQDAEALMPRTKLITRVQVTGAVHVEQGLNLQMLSNEQHSPYNPPLRFLRNELEELGHSSDPSSTSSADLKATLASTRQLTDNISRFTFNLSSSIKSSLPGGFGIFDFSEILDSGYSHMNEANPQAVNEDYVRTWTVSSAPSFNAETNQFSEVDQIDITVKRKPGGLISNFLHDSSSQIQQEVNDSLKVTLKGTGVGFSCFTQDSLGTLPSIPSKMLWIAGGVGITPFMSMWDGLMAMSQSVSDIDKISNTNIVLIFSGRGDDLNLLRHFLTQINSLPDNISLSILAFQTIGNEPHKAEATLKSLMDDFPDDSFRIEQRRIQQQDLENIENLLEREVFLCGPEPLMKETAKTLKTLGGDTLKIHQESFFF